VDVTDTGASIIEQPLRAAASATCRAVCGSIVEESISRLPDFAPAITPAPMRCRVTDETSDEQRHRMCEEGEYMTGAYATEQVPHLHLTDTRL